MAGDVSEADKTRLTRAQAALRSENSRLERPPERAVEVRMQSLRLRSADFVDLADIVTGLGDSDASHTGITEATES